MKQTNNTELKKLAFDIAAAIINKDAVKQQQLMCEACDLSYEEFCEVISLKDNYIMKYRMVNELVNKTFK